VSVALAERPGQTVESIALEELDKAWSW
jgi:hypothetical protein